MPTPSKKAKKMPNYDAHGKHHFFMPKNFKKAKFLEFGYKNANLATLFLVHHTLFFLQQASQRFFHIAVDLAKRDLCKRGRRVFTLSFVPRIVLTNLKTTT